MATDQELAAVVRKAAGVLRIAVDEAQKAGLTVKLGVVYGKAPVEEGQPPSDQNVVKDITVSLSKDF